jgi:RecB family exonuclease
MPPVLFGRYRDIASQVAERLSAGRGGDPLGPWSEEVIVASHGVADAISKALFRAQWGAGALAGERDPRPIAGLQLQTLEMMARRILNDAGEYPRVASEAERRLAMRMAARAIDDPMMMTRGIAAMLERSYRDVRDSGLTLDELRSRAERSRVRNRDRMRVVVRAFAEYERLIAAVGAIDPADLLTRAARAIGRVKIAPQIVAGFYDMTGVQRALIDALDAAAKIASVHIPAGDDEAYRFAQPFVGTINGGQARSAPHPAFGHPLPAVAGRGATTPEVSLLPARGEEVPPSASLRASFGRMRGATRLSSIDWHVAAYDRADLEVRAACEAAAKLLADGVQSIGIVARSLDPSDIHLFTRAAAEYGFRVSERDDIPLLSHRLGRAVASILRLRERGFPRGEVLEIIRDGFRAQTPINVDEADVKTREKRIAGGTSQELRNAQRRPKAVDDYIALVAELEALTSRLDAPLRGAEWNELLASIVSRFKFESERDLRAAECIDDVAAMFERADRMNVRFEIASVVDALEQITITDRDERSATVWLGDVMKFRGRTFEHLFAIHMQNDSFPQRRIEDALLPDSDRRLLGIREIGDGSEEEQLLFRLLFDGATSAIHFSLAASDGFGKVLRPSQLLKNFAIAERPSEKEALLKDFVNAWRTGVVWTGVGANPPLRPLQLLARSGTRGIFDGFIPDATLFSRALERVTPTQLEDFGECPQKFLLEHILGVSELDDPERELQINHRDKGSIDHRILEQFYRSLRDDDYDAARRDLPLLPEALAARLNDTIDAEFDRLESEAPAFNRNIRAIERSATKRILRDFVARDLSELLANDLRPRHFEYTFGEKFAARGYHVDHQEPFIITAAGVPIRVEGKIDRIDVAQSNVAPPPSAAFSDASESSPPGAAALHRIVDYKSGKALRHQDLGKKIDRGVRLQLAVYAMAVAEFFGIDAKNISGTIKPIVPGEPKPASFAFELAEKRYGLQETLDIFASAILRGQFPAFPNEKDSDFNSCKYCPVNHSCRTKHDLEEKYAVTRSKEPRTLLQEIG